MDARPGHPWPLQPALGRVGQGALGAPGETAQQGAGSPALSKKATAPGECAPQQAAANTPHLQCVTLKTHTTGPSELLSPASSVV
jgi:hypothetical protein